ncbi:MAG: hypothetical protein WDO69_25115 [Pseudomonadota bacterium]
MTAQHVSFVDFAGRLLSPNGEALTPAQRVLALVAFDNVDPRDLEGDEHALARQLFGDVEIVPPEARAVLVVLCGARSGKSRIICALYSLWRALVADLSTLAPGERAVALIVAPDIRLAKQTLRFAIGAAKQLLGAPDLVTDTQESTVICRPDDGKLVAIECLPATRGGSALRGRTLVSACLDESAFFRSEEFAVNDEEVFRAVAPRVLPGGLVVVASTPWAEAGLLHKEFSRNHGHPVTALAAHAPTLLMNPSKKREVDRELERDPENARREFGAEFLGLGSGFFFDAASLRACAEDLPLLDRCPPLSRAGIGGDLGLVRDCSAVVVVHREGPTLTVAEAQDFRPTKDRPLDLETVCKAFGETAERHGSKVLVVDQHMITEARKHVPEGFTLQACPGGQQGKVEMYTHARNLLRAGHVRIPRQLTRLREQLAQITSSPQAGGGILIRSPRRGGSHGDLVSAFVHACWAARRSIYVRTERSETRAKRQSAAGIGGY